jgi:hypothetical protein
MNPLANWPRSAARNRVREAVGRWMSPACIAVALLCFASPWARGGQSSQAPADVPVVDAAAGPCRADFTVTDASGKGIYAAHIHVLVRYGFLSQRKTDLDVGTNSDGKAAVTGLPSKVKKPLEYTVKYKDQSKSVMSDPGVDCHAGLKVQLAGQ